MSAAHSFKYRTFISYSHADTKVAKWLHGALEGFRIDRDLVGRDTPVGRIPATIGPVFRDRDEFVAGQTLNEQTIAALDQSMSVVVLCSPSAARSFNVNEEVRLFKSRHPDRPVIPVILDVATQQPEKDCFPPAVGFEVAADGSVTDRPSGALAADLREAGDGKELVLAKVVARLTGIGTDDVFRRAQRAQRRRQRQWIGGLSVVALGLAGLAIWAEINRREAVRQQQIAVRNYTIATEAADALIFDLASTVRNQEGMRTETVRTILGISEHIIGRLVASSPNKPALMRRQAAMLLEFADTYAAQGDSAKQSESVAGAIAILESLAAGDTADADARRQLAIGHAKNGDIQRLRGQLGLALASYEASRTILQRLTAADPGNIDLQHQLLAANDVVGTTLMLQNKFADAKVIFESNVASLSSLVAAGASDLVRQRNLAVAHNKLGELLLVQGQKREAIDSFRRALEVSQGVAAREPGNARWQHDIASIQSRIGDIQLGMGERPGALASFQESFNVLDRLAKSDPNHAERQYDLAVARERLAQLAVDDGKLDLALQMYRENLASIVPIRDRDQSNVLFQRSTRTAHNLIGEILVKQGKADDALRSFESALAIARKLAADDPANVQSQQGVVEIAGNLAKALETKGSLGDALAYRREALAIVERLNGLQPGNREREVELVSLYGGTGVLLVQMQRKGEAKAMLAKAHAVATSLLGRTPDDKRLQTVVRDLANTMKLLER